MTDLLREIAHLPQVGGSLSVEVVAGEPSRRFYLLRTATRPGADLAALQADETEGYARLLSGAPAMLDLLAVLLLRWDQAVAADEAIDGDEAAAWLSEFVVFYGVALSRSFDETALAFVHKSPTHGGDQTSCRRAAALRLYADLRRDDAGVPAEEHGRASLRDAKSQPPGGMAPGAGNPARSSVAPCSRPSRAPCGRRYAVLRTLDRCCARRPRVVQAGAGKRPPTEPRNVMRSVTCRPHSIRGLKRGLAAAETDLSQTFRRSGQSC